MTDECKCNTCKYREVTNIICPCIDCYDYSHYEKKGCDNYDEENINDVLEQIKEIRKETTKDGKVFTVREKYR